MQVFASLETVLPGHFRLHLLHWVLLHLPTRRPRAPTEFLKPGGKRKTYHNIFQITQPILVPAYVTHKLSLTPFVFHLCLELLFVLFICLLIFEVDAFLVLVYAALLPVEDRLPYGLVDVEWCIAICF